MIPDPHQDDDLFDYCDGCGEPMSDCDGWTCE